MVVSDKVQVGALWALLLAMVMGLPVAVAAVLVGVVVLHLHGASTSR